MSSTDNPASPSSRGGLFAGQGAASPTQQGGSTGFGPPGPEGPPGPAGADGRDGIDGSNGQSITRVEAGVEVNGEIPLTFFAGDAEIGVAHIPIGADGSSIREITTTPTNPQPGNNVTVTIVLTDDTVFNFVMPAGAQGLQGPMGMDGPIGPNGLIFVPVFFTEADDGQGGIVVENASLTLMSVHNSISYIRPDDTEVFTGTGYNIDDPTSNFNSDFFGRDILLGRVGYDALGSEGPRGLPGVSVGSVSSTFDADGNSLITFQLEDGTSISNTIVVQRGLQGLRGEQGPPGMGAENITSRDGTLNILQSGSDVDLSVPGVGDAISIQGETLPEQPTGTAPQLLEYFPDAQEWRYVPFPSGRAGANNTPISIMTGDHILLSQDGSTPRHNSSLSFTLNQTNPETISFDVVVDEALNATSIQAVENQVITAALNRKQDNLSVNSGATATDVLDSIGVNGVIYRVGGGVTPAHARLRTSLTLDTNRIQLPHGNLPITGTVSASIENALAGDAINNVTIRSVHSSYADDRTGSITVVDNMSSTFAWNFEAADAAQVVTFTVAYSVNGIIDGGVERNVHTDTVTLTIAAAPQHYWTGAVTQAELDSLESSLADDTIANIPAITQRDNFVSPLTLEYNGGAAGSTPSLYPVIIVDQSIVITSLRAEGIVQTITSSSDSGRTLYTTEAFLSEGPHNLTWRT